MQKVSSKNKRETLKPMNVHPKNNVKTTAHQKALPSKEAVDESEARKRSVWDPAALYF